MQSTPADSRRLSFEYAVRSDVGMRRATNQDALAVVPADGRGAAGPVPLEGDRFLMVADGMGAHAAGELASKMAVDFVPHAFLKTRSAAAPSALRQSIRDANERIHSKGSASPELAGMGTTCSCLVLTGGAALVAHVGDSRVYRLRSGLLEQLTFDHSLVWEMAAASKVTEDKVPSCIPKNVITRSLGPHESVNVDLEGPHELVDGDSFVLCSDGLTGVVEDALLGGLLGVLGPSDAVETLVDVANLRGGPDNISVIVARVGVCDGATRLPSATPGPSRGRTLGAIGLAGVCLAGLVWSNQQDSALGMLLAAAGLGGAAVAAFTGRPVALGSPVTAPLGPGDSASCSSAGAYGNGPYRRRDCAGAREAALSLRELVRELAELGENCERGVQLAVAAPTASPVGETLLVDWSPYRGTQEAADAAVVRGDFVEGVRRYSELVRTLMKAVREDDGTRRYRSPAAATGR
ncbi:MAG: PP2C family protein-serine/threonine phosphatase [Lacipirellulaceae bacterium]